MRQRIRAYGLRPLEEKLLSLLREFKKDEAKYLEWFAEAEDKGAGLPACLPRHCLPAARRPLQPRGGRMQLACAVCPCPAQPRLAAPQGTKA